MISISIIILGIAFAFYIGKILNFNFDWYCVCFVMIAGLSGFVSILFKLGY